MENNLDYSKMPQACINVGHCQYTVCICKNSSALPTPTVVDELDLSMGHAAAICANEYKVNEIPEMEAVTYGFIKGAKWNAQTQQSKVVEVVKRELDVYFIGNTPPELTDLLTKIKE